MNYFNWMLKIKNGDLDKTIEAIKECDDEVLKSKLIADLKQHFAKKYNVDVKDVFFGDYRDSSLKKSYRGFPYKVVVGDITFLDKNTDASNLKAVVGKLTAKRTTIFPELEYAKEIDFNGGIIESLPKLKEVGVFNAEKVNLKEFALKKAKVLNLKYATISDFHVTSVENYNLDFTRYMNMESGRKAGALIDKMNKHKKRANIDPNIL